MGMDIDYLIAKDHIEELSDILHKLDHGERELICDDIVEFVELMKLKYGKDE